MNSLFETALKATPEAVRQPLIDVADTMAMGRRWFEDSEVEYTAADLLKFAEMVLR